MRLIRKIRSKFFPPSSRYFGSEMAEIKNRLANIEDMEKVLSKKLDLYAMQIYRGSAESNFDARKRLFKSLPEANGEMRLYQQVNHVLLENLDRICNDNKLSYWMWCGSLVATVGREKAIPWDDDLDVCMMREDFEKLCNTLKKNEEFEISTVYDYLAANKQYRFTYKDKDILNFIDIVICDWGGDSSYKNEHKYLELKQELISELDKDPELANWRSDIYISSKQNNKYVDILRKEQGIDNASTNTRRNIRKLDAIFNKYLHEAKRLGIICDKDGAKSVIYSIDNLFQFEPRRKNIWGIDMIFPTHRMRYEAFMVNVPNNEKEFCSICFDGWPYIPNDICSHAHIPKKIFDNPDVIEKMHKIIDQNKESKIIKGN